MISWRVPAPRFCRFTVFIMIEKSPHLDGQYAAFGKVLDGMEADKLFRLTQLHGQTKGGADHGEVTVETFGKEYGEVEKV